MKTILALTVIALTATIGICGQPSVEPVSFSAVPPTYFKAGEFDFNLGAIGSYTQTAHAQDRYLGLDHALGGTLEAKYFPWLNFGGGISFSGYDARNSSSIQTGFLGQKLPPGVLAAGTSGFIDDVMLKVVARYPIGQFAPYAFVAGGAIFNGGNSTFTQPTGTIGKKLQLQAVEHDVKMIGEAGTGIEYRFTHNLGVFVEGAFDKIDRPQSNFFSVRSGLTVTF